MKRIAVVLADGFEEIEALTCVDVLRRAGFTCDTVSTMGRETVKSSHGIPVIADKLMDESLKDYDMIVCPGGHVGSNNLADTEFLIETLKEFNEKANEGKFIAAICAAPAVVLSRAGIEENRYITSYPGEDFEGLLEKANYVEELVVVDGNLITSRGPATTLLFAYKLVDVLGGDSSKLKEGMLWNMIENEN